MDYVIANIEHGSKWLWLLKRLDAAADDRQIFGLIPGRTRVVASHASVDALILLYQTALVGKTYICAGMSGSGKTTAAHYLLHGDYSLRPRRGMMIRADSYPNFEEDFARYLNAKGAAPLLYLILVRALMPKDRREQVVLPRGVGPAIDLVKSTFSSALKSCGTKSFETDLVHMHHGRTTQMKNRLNCTALPILTIDGLVKSEVNRNFVNKLYNAAVPAGIMVLILVKDPNWATELISLNGGVHILPVDGVISNPRLSVDLPFTDIPRWTMMRWNAEDLSNFATLVGIRDIQTRDGMTPQQFLDLQDGAREQDGDDGILFGVD